VKSFTGEKGVALMNKVLTMAEIEKRFPSEWVLLADPQTGEYNQVLSGTLLWHSKDRDEVHRKALESKAKYIAVFYTGTIPEGTAVLL
jgi:hypothetical protein